ncbi:MAG: hypothetical protein ACE5R3_06420 [Nitrosopumilaceae archaeon]
MPVSYVNLSGTRELPDVTMRALVEDNWTAANITGTITPVFQSATEEPDFLAEDDLSDDNLITFTWVGDERVDDPDNNEPNGDSIHHFRHIVRVDIWAEDMVRLRDFMDEVNNIIWSNSPNSATRLNKSDASASETDYFTNAGVDFDRIEPETDVDFKPSVSGIIELHYRKNKT